MHPNCLYRLSRPRAEIVEMGVEKICAFYNYVFDSYPDGIITYYDQEIIERDSDIILQAKYPYSSTKVAAPGDFISL